MTNHIQKPVPSSVAPEPGTRAALNQTVAAVLRALGTGGVVDDPILTREQATEIVGLSVSTLLRMARRGEGPAVTRLSPRRLGYRLSDLNAWVEAQRAINNQAD